MSLWSWAATAWTADGVELAALDLQDAQGQNIPLLLWAAWCAQTGRTLSEDDIDAACDTARAWEERVTGPLRSVRRSIKTRVPDMDDVARESVRGQVKAVELAAERHLLEALEALAPEVSSYPRDALATMAAVSRAWSDVTPRTALKLLSDRLPG